MQRAFFRGLFLGFLFVFLQQVLHGFFKKVIDTLVKIYSELLNILEDRHIQACSEGLSFAHEIFIPDGRLKVNK